MGSQDKQDTSIGSLQLNIFIKDPNKKVRSLVKKITHSGETDLNKEDLHELKQICKAFPDELMNHVYQELMKCLRKDHSQVRVAALKLLDYLFQKSHIIRRKLLDEFDTFIELTLALSEKSKVKIQLPPPKKYASLLKELAIKVIHKWHAEYADGYEKLRYAYRYYKEHQLIDFGQLQVNTQEQLINRQKLAEKQEKILTRSIENRLREYKELKPELLSIIAQIESLIELLVPSDDQTVDRQSNDEHFDSLRRQHGIVDLSQSITVEFNPFVEVRKDDDNKDLVENLKELKKELISDKLAKLIAIEKTIAKRSEQLVGTLKDIIDLKTRSTNVVLKLGELRILNEDDVDSRDSDVDDEFEDVEEKEDLESYIPKRLRVDYGLEPIDPKEMIDHSRIVVTDESFSVDQAGPSTSRIATDDVGPAQACNVRLDSGKLCPRRDKIKCPFHGKIIPRDLCGVPIDEEARLEEERRSKVAKKVPDWQDPDLLADIQAATGVDLRMPKRGGKSNKISPKKNLLNPKTCDQTSKQRLQRRLKMLMR